MQPSVRTVNYTIHCNMKSIKTLEHKQLWLPVHNRKLPFTIRVKAASVSFPAAPAAPSLSHHLSLLSSHLSIFVLPLLLTVTLTCPFPSVHRSPAVSLLSGDKWPFSCVSDLLSHPLSWVSSAAGYLILYTYFKGENSWKAALLKHNYVDILQHLQNKPKLQSRCQNHENIWPPIYILTLTQYWTMVMLISRKAPVLKI